MTQQMTVANYELLDELGYGNFSKVKLARHVRTNQYVAIKIMQKSKIGKDSLQKAGREIKVMRLLNHPHIVKLDEVIETTTHLYLILEYCSGGDIFDYIELNGKLNESESRKFFKQIVSAIEYCHGRHVLHRDLKLENLLLDDHMNIKVADFGFTNTYKKDRKLLTSCGSPPYAAPELFLGKPYYGPEIDVWSLGVVLFAMSCGNLPFSGKNIQEIRREVLRGKVAYPKHLTDDCVDLISRILVPDPQLRYNLNDIKNHIWMNQLDGKECVPDSKNCKSTVSSIHLFEKSDQISFGIDKLPNIFDAFISQNNQEELLSKNLGKICINDLSMEISETSSSEKLSLNARKFTFATFILPFADPDQCKSKLVEILNSLTIEFAGNGFLFDCKLHQLEFELEICKIINLDKYGLRHRRKKGDIGYYRLIYTKISNLFK
eukprot:NODE_264_length_11354_cov_1.067170.p3 type:complete len:434 gc:universal NODE_264_length_11354_cov_1.067170:4469-5770(+)